jgi:hypothetical protein
MHRLRGSPAENREVCVLIVIISTWPWADGFIESYNVQSLKGLGQDANPSAVVTVEQLLIVVCEDESAFTGTSRTCWFGGKREAPPSR